MPRARRSHARETTPIGGVRERILDAGLAILRESGVRRFSQVQVAEQAGVRQSHVTYYFPSRRDLLEAVMARVVDGIAHGVRRALEDDDGRDPGPMLERLAEAVAELEHMRMFVASVVEADGDPALRALMVDATHRLEEELAGALGGDDARERARLVLTALWGLGLYRFLVRPSRSTDPTAPYLSWVAEVASRPTRAARRRGGAR